MGMWAWPLTLGLLLLGAWVRFEIVTNRRRQRAAARLREHGTIVAYRRSRRNGIGVPEHDERGWRW